MSALTPWAHCTSKLELFIFSYLHHSQDITILTEEMGSVGLTFILFQPITMTGSINLSTRLHFLCTSISLVLNVLQLNCMMSVILYHKAVEVCLIQDKMIRESEKKEFKNQGLKDSFSCKL